MGLEMHVQHGLWSERDLSPCQMVSLPLSVTSMLMIPACMCSSPQVHSWPLTPAYLFCAASCSQLYASKSQALVQSQPPASATVCALLSISFITGLQTIKHLGVRLGYDMPAACIQTFSSIHQAIRAKVRHWSARGLSFLGRVHVAKQVLAASMWYHVTFQRPPEQLLQHVSRQLSDTALCGFGTAPQRYCSGPGLGQPSGLCWAGGGAYTDPGQGVSLARA